MKSKRRYPRKKHSLMIGVHAAGESTFEELQEISEGGLLAEITRFLPIGQEVRISFHGPGFTGFSATGKVAYRIAKSSRARGVGVRFTGAETPLTEKIRSLVRRP
jgi:Tfp pilus assembly protein PilZ